MSRHFSRATFSSFFICFSILIAVGSFLPVQRRLPEDYEQLTTSQLAWLWNCFQQLDHLYGNLARPRFGRSTMLYSKDFLKGKGLDVQTLLKEDTPPPKEEN